MRYPTDLRFRKCVKGYCFLSFPKKIGNKYGKKLMDTATKTGMDAAKFVSKRVVQKTAKATGDLIGNKIADKITSIGTLKERKQKILKKVIFDQKKKNKLLMVLDCFECNSIKCKSIEHKMCLLLYKNGISENCKFSRHNSDDKKFSGL